MIVSSEIFSGLQWLTNWINIISLLKSFHNGNSDSIIFNYEEWSHSENASKHQKMIIIL